MSEERDKDESEQPVLKTMFENFVVNFGLSFLVAFVLAFMGASWEQILVVTGIVYGWENFMPFGKSD